MWECAMCGEVLWKDSGVHRDIRTKSGHHRVASLCPRCAAKLDGAKLPLWRTVLAFVGLAVAATVAVAMWFKPF